MKSIRWHGGSTTAETGFAVRPFCTAKGQNTRQRALLCNVARQRPHGDVRLGKAGFAVRFFIFARQRALPCTIFFALRFCAFAVCKFFAVRVRFFAVWQLFALRHSLCLAGSLPCVDYSLPCAPPPAARQRSCLCLAPLLLPAR